MQTKPFEYIAALYFLSGAITPLAKLFYPDAEISGEIVLGLTSNILLAVFFFLGGCTLKRSRPLRSLYPGTEACYGFLLGSVAAACFYLIGQAAWEACLKHGVLESLQPLVLAGASFFGIFYFPWMGVQKFK